MTGVAGLAGILVGFLRDSVYQRNLFLVFGLCVVEIEFADFAGFYISAPFNARPVAYDTVSAIAVQPVNLAIIPLSISQNIMPAPS